MGELINLAEISNSQLEQNLGFDLDPAHYFESLLLKATQIGLISEESSIKLQTNLFNLLKQQINRYTSFESTSVQIEKAQDILSSIYYTIGVSLKQEISLAQQVELLQSGECENLFINGQKEIKNKIIAAKKRMQQLQSETKKVPTLAYQDTIMAGIPDFFTHYDYKYAAHESAGSIDYPLSYDTMKLTGIDYIEEYLEHLSIENAFCKRVPAPLLEELLKSYSFSYREDLMNAYELVLTNLLARKLLSNGEIFGTVVSDINAFYSNSMNGEFYEEGICKQSTLKEIRIDAGILNITNSEREVLYKEFKKYEKADIINQLNLAFDEIVIEFGIKETRNIDYLRNVIKNISHRVKQGLSMNTLDKVFLSVDETEARKEKHTFIIGSPMKDDNLRELIEIINECEYTENKIEIMKEHVTSLYDYVELVEVCFFKEEYDTVFSLLNEEERYMLWTKKIPNNFSDFLFPS